MSSKKMFVCVYIQNGSEAERLTKERKITIETYSKTKTPTICIQ